MNGARVRRDVADLMLEALDVAGSRNLAWGEALVLIHEVLSAERPDISAAQAKALIERAGRRLFGRMPRDWSGVARAGMRDRG